MPSSPRTPRSPRKTLKLKKARSYHLLDLIGDLETGDFDLYQPAWLLRPFGWDGTTVTIHNKEYPLMSAALHELAYRAFRIVLEDCQPTAEAKNAALLTLCASPEGKTVLLNLLLDHGAAPETRNEQGQTALHIAATNKASLQFLNRLALHMNVNLTNNNGDAVLHQAIRSSDYATARLLLKHGADPNQADGAGQLPLVTAAHLTSSDACLQVLLRNGANVHERDGTGHTALSSIENPAASMLLLERGARSDVPDGQGVTPLHTVFQLWSRWRRGEKLSVLLFQENAVFDLLLKQAHGQVDLRDNYKNTPMHRACEVPYAPSPDYVQALVRAGADVHAVDANGWTPLHVATAFGNYATAARLLELGADVESRDSWGRTPMHCLGMDALARAQMSGIDLAYSIRVIAFGTDVPPATFVAPLSAASTADQKTDENHNHAQEDAARELVESVLFKGFDFRSTDNVGNLPFFYAENTTVRYLALQAAACQGLLR